MLKRKDRISYKGRKISGSTAVGSKTTHKKEIDQYLKDIFG